MLNLVFIDNPFEYDFMIRAAIAVLLISFILPFSGLSAVSKRMSMIGDTISHTSLCGIAIGLVSGMLPIGTAIIVSVLAGVLLEVIRSKFPKFSEISLSLVLSLAIGITGILTSYANSNSFESYLFGSLLTVSEEELYILLAVAILLVLYTLFFYRSNLAIGYNENEAKVTGLPVFALNILNMVFITASLAVSSAIIGSLLVSSLIVIPVACSLKLFKSYGHILISSVVISLLTGFIGLLLSYYCSINTGSTIILLGLFLLLVIFVVKALMKRKEKSSLDKKE